MTLCGLDLMVRLLGSKKSYYSPRKKAVPCSCERRLFLIIRETLATFHNTKATLRRNAHQ